LKPRVGISAGDPRGIGPEIITRALDDARVKSALQPVLFGDLRPSKKNTGRLQYEYLQAAIAAAKKGEVDAQCTAPVSKEQIARAGIPFMGHTEVLAKAFGVEVLMLMAGPKLNVALATNHLPLRKVPRALNSKKLLRQIELLSRSLGAPRIAVCGLNPHAGEGGLLGTEDREVIAPAVRAAKKRGLKVEGPLAADGLFAKVQGDFPYGAVLAMFHDQGLCVAKALDFRHTVNVTLGVPLPRTSPDHGVAYDIAGKNLADPEPMIQALLMAVKLAGMKRH